jgi:hypothetical protein
MDIDALGNLVVAGQTSDPSIHPYGAGVTYYPLVVFIDTKYNMNRWVKTYNTNSFTVKRI